MDNITKLSSLKRVSKNFTSVTGSAIYKQTVEHLEKVYKDPRHAESSIVDDFLLSHKFYLKHH